MLIYGLARRPAASRQAGRRAIFRRVSPDFKINSRRRIDDSLFARGAYHCAGCIGTARPSLDSGSSSLPIAERF
jgi:hypothetical protein